MERLGLGGREMTSSGHSKNFVLRVVQPGLTGLMDGSVSTLAPLFATAFATREPRITFLVGLAAAVGAAISMGFSEGLSDDGTLTGRGHPLVRGMITGVATFVGGILHTLPVPVAAGEPGALRGVRGGRLRASGDLVHPLPLLPDEFLGVYGPSYPGRGVGIWVWGSDRKRVGSLPPRRRGSRVSISHDHRTA